MFKLKYSELPKSRVGRLPNGRVDPVGILIAYEAKPTWTRRDIVRIERIIDKCHRVKYIDDYRWRQVESTQRTVADWRRIEGTPNRLNRKSLQQEYDQRARVCKRIQKQMSDRRLYLFKGVKLFKTMKARDRQVDRILGADHRYQVLRRRAERFNIYVPRYYNA